MPASAHHALSLGLDHVARLEPKSVLDIGFGLGKWGMLLREVLDIIAGRVDPDEWVARIDGIDAVAHESPIVDWAYDDIRICDVRDVVDELSGYDLVLMADIIEHFEKEPGLALLTQLLAQNRNVLITTPFHFGPQVVDGNPYETHRSHWTIDDFRPWAFDYDAFSEVLILVLIAGRDAVRPTRADAVASRVAYAVPGLAGRGASARVVKQLVRPLARAVYGG
jgi:hypothetical protein